MTSLRNITLPSAPRVWLPGETTPYRKNIHVFMGKSQHFNKDGELIWEEKDWVSNILHDEGEQAILSAYFDTDASGFGAPPANIYMGLDARTTLAEADDLNDLVSEPAGNGYAREAISTSTGFSLSQPGAYYIASMVAAAEFQASGGSWGSLRNRFFATTADNSGKLIASLVFSTSPRTIGDGDKITTDLAIGLHE